MKRLLIIVVLLYLHAVTNAQVDEITRLNNRAWDLKFSEPEKALSCTDSALNLLGGKEVDALTEVYKIRGVIYLLTGKNIEAIHELTVALRYAERYKDSLAIGKITNNLASVYLELANYKEAVKYSYESLQMMEALKNTDGIIPAYSNLGNVYSAQENYPKAIEFYERAIKLSEKSKKTALNGLASLKSDLAAAYKNNNKPQKALSYYIEALDLFTKENNDLFINNQLVNIGSVYIDLKDFEKAEDFLNRGLKGKNEIGDEQGIAQIYFNLGELNRLKGMYPQSKNYYLQSLEIAKENENLNDQLLAVGGLATVDETTGNFKGAFAWQKKYQLYKDSLNNATTYDQINTFQTLYETERKDKAIELLNKEKEVQNITIDRKNIQQFFLITLIFAATIFSLVFFLQRKRIAREKKSSETLLLNILPVEVANELKRDGKATSKPIENATVLFTDFVDFTRVSETMTAEQLVELLNHYFSAFDKIIERYTIEKIKTIGDAYMAVGGLNSEPIKAAENVILAALEIAEFVKKEQQKKASENLPHFDIRLGVHSGPIVAGIVGTHKFQYDIWGDTVNTASRLESAGAKGKINISKKTFQLVSSKFEAEARGTIEVKGKGALAMFFITKPKG